MSDYKALNAIAYGHLRRMIYASELEFNKVYSETKLAAQLSISRTPIRDALNRLAQERYIDILPNRGFRLAEAELEDALVQQQRLLEDDSAYSISQFWLDDLAFHKAPLEYLNIPSLITQYESFMYVFMPHHLIREFDAHQKQPLALERHRSTLVEHAAITEALKSHDVDRIKKAIRTHLDSSLKALYVRMEN